VLFRQWRFGLGNRPIFVLKFRTMRIEGCDATGERRTVARDSRVTRVGRFLRRTSIDELPQLINVLRGEMSLVGPRPHPLHMRVGDSYYFDAVSRYRVRHLVKPGITGWAQINGSRGEVDTLEKARRRVELDLWYLQNWSLVLDFRILLSTALGRFGTWHAD
jgi:lipopolysaccharide/colanic/teichoic acid biosynthesis glycosyltransferase